MMIHPPPPGYATLDDRINAALSDGAKSDDIVSLIRECTAAEIAATDTAERARLCTLDPVPSDPDVAAARRKMEDATLRRDELNDAGKRLHGLLQEERAREDRRRLLAKIAKILGHRWLSPIKDDRGSLTPKAIVEAELFRLETTRAALERIRSRWSKPQLRAAKQFGNALRKANRPKDGLHEDLRLLFGLNQMICLLEAYEANAPRPKSDAYAKRMATQSAMYLCETFGIPLSTTRKTGENTKASVFCELAAVLYGNESTDMQHYCREAIRKRRTSANLGQK